MARLEKRVFLNPDRTEKRVLLVIQETKEEGALLDWLAPIRSPGIVGEVCISDGYGDIYACLEGVKP